MSALPIRRNGKTAGPVVLITLTLCAILAFSIGGCKDEPTTKRQATKKVVPAPPPKPAPQEAEVAEAEPKEAESLPLKLEPSEEAQQDTALRPRAKRDPFKSFVTTRTAVSARKEDAPKIKTPLQRYSLDQLKVVGIIGGGNVRKALLEDDVGKGYVVAVGDAVGSEGGEISAIKKDRIIIESTYRDVLGNKKVRRITKKLYIAEEGENP
jgi:Tfp pilus assembly protein PilP